MKGCKEVFGNISFILKFAAWVILLVGSVIIALGDVMYFDEFTLQTCAVAVAGYTLILTGMLIIFIFDNPHRLLELLLLITGAILNFVAGILNIVEYLRAHDSGRTTNSLILVIMCLAAACIMTVDVVFMFQKK